MTLNDLNASSSDVNSLSLAIASNNVPYVLIRISETKTG